MFRRILFSILALLVLALFVSGLIAARSIRNAVEAETLRRLEGSAETLRRRLGPNDRSALPKAVREMGQSLPDVGLTVIGEDGAVLAESSRADPDSTQNQNDRPEVLQARSEGRGTHVRHSAGLGHEMMYTAVFDPSSGIVVRAALPLSAIEREWSGLFLRLAAAWVATSAAGGLVAFLLARSITRPLTKIRAVAGAVTAGDFALRAPLEAGGGEIGAVSAAMNRMSEELSARLATLTQERAKLETVIASMEEAVIAVDAEGRVLHYNRALKQLLGIEFDPMGLRIWEVLRLPGLEERVHAAFRERHGSKAEYTVGKRTVSIGISPVGGGEQGAVLVASDTTEQHRYETLRREFVANVSHELRTPLSIIRGYAETLCGWKDLDPTQAGEFVEIIHKHSVQLSNLIEDLLQLARVESGGGIAKLRRFKVRELLARVVDNFRAAAAKAGNEISVEPGPEVDAVADPDLLERAVSNLVDNAIKYTPQGGRVTVAAQEAPTEVRIEVRDTGIGILAKEIPRIFERFYRVDKSRSRELGGTGLGLSIVKHVMQVHSGSVEVSSESGKGSLFTLRLNRTSA